VFTGIVETIGEIIRVEGEQSNIKLVVQCDFANELKIDQSIAHNGVCLTVTDVDAKNKTYCVVAVEETLNKTNLGNLKVEDKINLERCVVVGSRLDGHMVQGHVDAVAVCTNIENRDGSWKFTFENDGSYKNLLVTKGSVCVNGVSLTVIDAKPELFSVAIIPYTFNNTIFQYLTIGSKVNVEFDVLGKYALAYMAGTFN
jgi:riboflavin synthase